MAKECVATIDYTDIAQTDIILTKEAIKESARAQIVGSVIMGFSRPQITLEVDERGIAYVDMNGSGRLDLKRGNEGVIATSALAGCTGVAGYSRSKDGSVKAFVSHYDAITQAHSITGQGSPAVQDLWRFKHDALTADPVADVEFFIAYPLISTTAPEYGRRLGKHDQWYYLDQLETTAEYLGEGTRVVVLPYDYLYENTLASGRINGHEGIFWNGVLIDFDTVFSSRNPSGNYTNSDRV